MQRIGSALTPLLTRTNGLGGVRPSPAIRRRPFPVLLVVGFLMLGFVSIAHGRSDSENPEVETGPPGSGITNGPGTSSYVHPGPYRSEPAYPGEETPGVRVEMTAGNDPEDCVDVEWHRVSVELGALYEFRVTFPPQTPVTQVYSPTTALYSRYGAGPIVSNPSIFDRVASFEFTTHQHEDYHLGIGYETLAPFGGWAGEYTVEQIVLDDYRDDGSTFKPRKGPFWPGLSLFVRMYSIGGAEKGACFSYSRRG